MIQYWQKRYYIAFALPAIAIAGISIIIFYALFSDNFNEQIMENGHMEIEEKTALFHRYVEQGETVLKTLHSNPHLLDYLRDRNPENRKAIELVFETIMHASPELAQLRFIDTQGIEQIKYARGNPGAAAPVTAIYDSKADKSQHYFFKEAITHPAGTTWYSRLDLNIENGQIERPIKPVLRLARAIDIDGVRHGILILNLFAQPILEQLAHESNYYVYLFDQDGEFIIHKARYRNWSRYLHTDETLHTLLPNEAEKMLKYDEYSVGKYHSHTLNLDNGEGLKILLELKEDIINDNKRTSIMIALFSSLMLFLLMLPFIHFSMLRRTNEINKNLDQTLQKELAEHRHKDNLLLQQSKMAIMGEMLSMIAHQWRQPLSSISAIAARIKIKNELDDLDKKSIDEACDNINDLSQFLSNTINDFRDFFRPKESVEITDVGAIIDKALVMLDGIFTKHAITLTKEYDDAKPIETYGNELLQVVLNIIKNAVDALSDDETNSAPEIVISLNQHSDFLSISICDNGSDGIPKALQERIFEPYFTTKDDINGTGLGLYMSKVIVEEHLEGSLSVKSAPGGTCFSIALPQQFS